MKTAMKKIFSLMLVAVLLVGIMPFQAFAATTWYQIIYVGENKDRDNGLLTQGETFRPSDYIPEGYEFVSCTQNFGNGAQPASIDEYETREIGDGDSFVMEVKKAAPPVCGNCGETGHATGAYAYCEDCNKCNGHDESAYCTVLANGEACGKAHCTDAHCPKCGLTTHDETAHCTFEGCGLTGHTEEDHCDNCGEYTCDGCVDSTPLVPATIQITLDYNYRGSTDSTWPAQNGQDLEAVVAGIPSAPNRAGYQFSGWYLNDECTIGIAGKTANVRTVLYAKWTPDTPIQDIPDEPGRKVILTLNFNYRGADEPAKMEVARGANLKEILVNVTEPVRNGYKFSHWTYKDNKAIGDNDKVSDRGTTVYAHWVEDKNNQTGYKVELDLNYDRKMGDSLKVAKDARMGDVLKNVKTPTRWGYKFAGWYWDAQGKNDVERNDKVTDHANRDKVATIYAKWERKNTNEEIMLKIYLNENAKSAVKIVDLHDYAKDGRITKDEVDKIVKSYYTAKSSSDDMDIDGLFTSNTWNHGKYNMRNAEKSIRVNEDDDTIIYVMVRDAKARSSSSSTTADASNPKTGDMIMTPVMVLGASAACLAVLFYLNKKRAI